MLTLSEVRRSYRPKIPALLRSPKSVVFRTQKADPIQDDIAPLFPLTSKIPVLEGIQGKGADAHPSLKIGVVFSGGPAPGGHNVIAGVFDTLAQLGKHQLIGFMGGPAASSPTILEN